MADFKLTQQDAPRAQATLFEGIGTGKAEAELLRRVAKAVGLATVDDLLGWRVSYSGEDAQVQGACIKCSQPRIMPADAHRNYCEACGTHTVCRVQDIARGDTPGPVEYCPICGDFAESCDGHAHTLPGMSPPPDLVCGALWADVYKLHQEDD